MYTKKRGSTKDKKSKFVLSNSHSNSHSFKTYKTNKTNKSKSLSNKSNKTKKINSNSSKTNFLLKKYKIVGDVILRKKFSKK